MNHGTMQGRNADEVLRRLSLCSSFEEVRAAGFLFHGTCERLEGDLHGGSYDGIFWTAAAPSVAQAYIPAAGLVTWLRAPRDWERGDPLPPTPEDGFQMRWACERAGVSRAELEITWQARRPMSWRVLPGWLSRGDFEDHLQSLGYRRNDADLYEIKLGRDAGGERIMAAGERMDGQLVVLQIDDLAIVDAPWSESEQGFSNHNRLEDFARFSEQGIEAFRMQDLLQSDHLGNVGHEAIGLTPAGLARASWLAIPARRHDGDSIDTWDRPQTPEFVELMLRINRDYRPESGAEDASPSP